MFGRDLISLMRAGYVLAREGAFAPVDARALPAGPRTAITLARLIERREGGRRLAGALERLGPSYVKLGQFLATRRDLVGQRVATDLSSLQDRLPPFDTREARKAVEDELGQPIEEMFAEFGGPVAAASIAQVHKARLKDGRAVAVKILRPGVERRFARDLRTFATAARLGEAFSGEARRLRLKAVGEELARSAKIEMDLRLEAAAIAEMGENTKDDAGFRVPAVIWEATGRRVLTTEWIDGHPMSDLEGLRASHHDLPKLAVNAIQSFLRHAMRDGFFHADMHPGNLFVEPDGTLVAVDFGIMGRLGSRERTFLAEILWGFIRQDYRRTAEVHFEAGYVPHTQSVDDFAQALRAIGTPIRDQSASDISMARLLAQLLEVTELFSMRTRPELLLLQKTMVVVEGVARNLDPRFDMWASAEPVVGEWIARNLGPAGRIAGAADGLGTVARVAQHVPNLLQRAERLAQDFADAAEEGRLRERQTNRCRDTALWIGAVSLAVIALAQVF
ncbi:2-polyprenylphenol 6-hydroxylase [Tepidamorphus sp. 3E244]|uniref:2-polyprenylphenol 6-hydroxylase n=1 Tax=Tepidamorphus sp. 3E244 TaxID=3385498 RepID=UPI0038FD3D6B